ncbi:hypothetical protein ABVT39_012968 [Epinephelus coioides]
MVIQLKVHDPRGQQHIIDVCDGQEDMEKITVQQLKKKIAHILKMHDDFRMVFRTEPLEEAYLLSQFKIKHMSTVHMLLMVTGGA